MFVQHHRDHSFIIVILLIETFLASTLACVSKKIILNRQSGFYEIFPELMFEMSNKYVRGEDSTLDFIIFSISQFSRQYSELANIMEDASIWSRDTNCLIFIFSGECKYLDRHGTVICWYVFVLPLFRPISFLKIQKVSHLKDGGALLWLLPRFLPCSHLIQTISHQTCSLTTTPRFTRKIGNWRIC